MKALAGKRIVVTRAADRAAELRDALLLRGAEVYELPTITYLPPDNESLAAEALQRLRSFDYVIFTSATAVIGLCEIGAKVSSSFSLGATQARFIAVGETTASHLRGLGVDAAVGCGRGAEGVIALLRDEPLMGKHILLPRAQEGREELHEWLLARGAAVTVAPVYKTAPSQEARAKLPGYLARGVDVVTFTSPSTVEGFAAAAGPGFNRPSGMLVACIGRTTAEAAAQAGLPADIIAPETSAEALAGAIGDYFASNVIS